jgi:hypothetical protein
MEPSNIEEEKLFEKIGRMAIENELLRDKLRKSQESTVQALNDVQELKKKYEPEVNPT